jgi:hypothetical protein
MKSNFEILSFKPVCWASSSNPFVRLAFKRANSPALTPPAAPPPVRLRISIPN